MTTPFPKKLRHSLTHLAVIVRHDPIRKDGIPLTHIALVDRNVNCLALPKCKVESWDIYYGQWKAGQITAVQCYKQLGISASTFYRLVREYETEEKKT